MPVVREAGGVVEDVGGCANRAAHKGGACSLAPLRKWKHEHGLERERWRSCRCRDWARKLTRLGDRRRRRSRPKVANDRGSDPGEGGFPFVAEKPERFGTVAWFGHGRGSGRHESAARKDSNGVADDSHRARDGTSEETGRCDGRLTSTATPLLTSTALR